MHKSRSSIASEHQLALLRQKLKEPEPTSVPVIYRPALSTVTVLTLIETDQCCSLKVTTLALVQGSAM